MGIEPKIIFLDHIEGKIRQKVLFWQHCYRNMATLLIVQFSNWVHWIPRLEKHGYGAQNYVSKPIGREVMMKIVINQSKFPWKSHFCDVIQKNRFPAIKKLFFTKTQKRTPYCNRIEHLKSSTQNRYFQNFTFERSMTPPNWV